ncbi:ABC transporter substrate-binding protein [Paracoccus pantotrophus]|uniref:Thiamine pyrimidine synthase n=2 Tax=Paracoccus pantotrophus TaxID=82367 RepID=A0A7H9BUZ0_PARPN|nr:ABC transporter substrate-binding protein [Paracoccus pantotrophus]RNI17624.1 nitrate ABC transporter substrate-binding protein [Paracoccus pantotrophus]
MKRMTKTPIAAALLLVLAALTARAEDLTVQLSGVAPAESAGYLVAEARGYYAEEGLTVRLLAADQAAPPFETLARGEADLAVAWMSTALVARENGLPLVNIAQIFARPALRLTCLRETGVTSAADLRGKTIGSRFGGTEYPLQAWLNRLGLVADGSLSGVSLLAQWPGAEMLRQKQAACISTLSHDPVPGEGLVELDPQDQGAAVLEDGLYVLAGALTAPEAEARLARFLRASMKGWHEAVAAPEDSARLILGPDPDPGALQQQAGMLRGIAGLLSATGALDEADYRRTVETLRAGGSRAVLRREPEGAFTAAVSDRATPPEAAAADRDAAPLR